MSGRLNIALICCCLLVPCIFTQKYGTRNKFQANIVASFVTERSQPVYYEIAKPALMVAFREASRRFPAISFNLIVNNDSDTCYYSYAGGPVSREYHSKSKILFTNQNHNVINQQVCLAFTDSIHAIFGPVCVEALDQVARMAAYWDVPIFTAGGFDASFSDKTIYPTLTRLSFSLDHVSHFIIQIFRENDWHHIALIVDESDPNMALIRKSLDLMFRLESNDNDYDISLDIETIDNEARNQTENFVQCLQRAAEKARGLSYL